jgi:predicted MFS family arabinose efflux permease
VAGPLAAFLIRGWGWRGAFLALGALVAVVALPASACVRLPAAGPLSVSTGSAPVGGPGGASFREALSGSPLWYLAAAWALLGMVYMMMTVHAVPYARDRGLVLERAALALTAYGLGAAVGRLGAGALADRVGGQLIMTVTVLAQVVALAAFAAGPPVWALVPLLVLFGMGAAGADNAFVKIIPDVFGVGALALVTSVLSLGWRSGAAVGPTAAGYVYDVTGSYALPFAAGVAMLAGGFALFSLATRRPGGASARGGDP